MAQIKINNKFYHLPLSWNDITYKQYLLLTNTQNGLIGTLSILLKIPNSELDALITTKEIEKQLLTAINWCNKVPNLSDYNLPRQLIVGGKEMEVAKDLDYTTFGQRVFAQELLTNKKLDSENLPMLVATYFEPLFFERAFDSNNVLEFSERILQCKFFDVWRIGSFFLRKLLGLPKNGADYLSRYKKILQKNNSTNLQAVSN